jgi:hypothetical protein
MAKSIAGTAKQLSANIVNLIQHRFVWLNALHLIFSATHPAITVAENNDFGCTIA